MTLLDIIYEKITDAVEKGILTEEEARDEWRWAKEQVMREMDKGEQE